MLRFFATLLLALQLLLTGQAWAQSASCSASEDLATFSFGTTNVTTATGSTRTWANGATSNSYNVSNFGSPVQHTISFNVTTNTNAPLLSPAPNLVTRGNFPNSLDFRLQATGPNEGVTLTIAFNRPVNNLSFPLLDLDYVGFQDFVRVSGFLNGVAVPRPTFIPNSPANNTQSVSGSFQQIKTIGGINCGNNDPSCNVQINFSGLVDSVVIGFSSGPDIPAPSIQQVAFNGLAYCVPKVDLALSKAAVSPTFIVGNTGTYTLTINNQGGVATSAPLLIQDVLQLPGSVL